MAAQRLRRPGRRNGPNRTKECLLRRYAATHSLFERGRKIRRAFHYAIGGLSPEDAGRIILDCEDIAEAYPLMVLTARRVGEIANERYGDQAAALDCYLAPACAKVANIWEPGDDIWFASNWALENAVEYAAQDGITLAEDEEKTERLANPVSKGEDRNA